MWPGPQTARSWLRSEDGRVRLWDIGTQVEVARLPAHPDGWARIAFSRDGHHLATSGADGTRVWTLPQPRTQRVLGLDDGLSTAAVWSGQVATADGTGAVTLWDAATGERGLSWSAGDVIIKNLAVSPDGRWLAASPYGKGIRVYPSDGSGPPVGSLDVPMPGSLVWSRDGAALYATSRRNPEGVFRWDGSEWSEVPELATDASPYELAISADGTVLALLDLDRTAYVYEAATLKQVARKRMDGLRTIALSPDGQTIALGNTRLTLWNWREDKVVWTSDEHDGALDRITWSPDGSRVATASWDQTARLFDASTGEPLAILRGHRHRVVDVSFSEDGRTLYTASWDRTSQRWDLSTLDSAGEVLEADALRTHGLRVIGAAAEFSP
ncbi:MAG: WD40 repeat domain-containing protein [Deltaproteobacteria bacterium]|nr:MAG: WD40 repeat domain-containing protein [Deltaproteobacteria bacterium]